MAFVKSGLDKIVDLPAGCNALEIGLHGQFSTTGFPLA
jgi:hypothetical protein